MMSGKRARNSLDVSLACVHRSECSKWCTEIDSAHPRRQLELYEHNRCRITVGAGRAAHGVPIFRLDARQPKNLLDRPHKPLLLFLSLLVRTQFRKLACDGNSAETLLGRERVRHPVVATVSWGFRRRRGRDVTLSQTLCSTSFVRRLGATSVKTAAMPESLRYGSKPSTDNGSAKAVW